MQPLNNGGGSNRSEGAGGAGLTPRMSSGISFREVGREVGDWFKTLGDDLGSALGIPRKGTLRRSPTPSGPSGLSVPSMTLPATSILAKRQQIVVGMLLKFVNLGWRPRLFVLQDGVLRYYKVYGPTAVNVHHLLEALRQQGELYPIGAEVSLLESRDQRMSEGAGIPSSPRSPHGSRPKLPQASGEIHLQVASLRESNADYRKFYVHSGTSALTLRAESKEDRWVWMQALQTSKGSWEGMTPTEASALKRDASVRIVSQDERFMAHLQEVRRSLAAKGVGKEAQDYVEDLLVQEHQRYHEVLVGEENKRRALLDIVYALENEKRQLETAMVVEGTQAAAMRHRHTSSAGSDTEDQLAEYERQESGAVGSPGVGEEGDDAMSSDADDEFYECESGSVKGSVHSMAHHGASNSVDLTGFTVLEGGVSSGAVPLATAEPASSGGGGAAAATPLRRSASRQSLPAPDSLGASPGRAALTGALAGTAAAAGSRAAAGQQGQQGGQGAAALAQGEDAEATPAAGVDPGWLAGQGPPPPRRDRLPPPRQQEKSVSLWSLIKDMVGKDLTRVCLPVYFNEPLSALQKTAEDLEYSELLDQAAELPPRSVERLLRVAAFAVSPYSSTPGRTAKPFNPLLGETFEFVSPEKGFRWMGPGG